MKNTICAALVYAALATTPALAGGLSDPVVVPEVIATETAASSSLNGGQLLILSLGALIWSLSL